MNETMKSCESNEIDLVKQFLKELGFICISYPSAQNLIYSKNDDTIIIKNQIVKI